tara:strand:+ start:30732 stop:31301 length:570 start_codon:yes stop_codon:yes gene_type:complete
MTLGATPAFNPKMLSDTVIGDGRVPTREAMYDPGSYDFERGFGYLMADALISGDTESRSETAPGELAIQRAQLAQVALDKALRADPGNAHAWAALAWARIRQGDEGGATDALNVSWNIAPYNLNLARTRLDLASVLAEFSDLNLEQLDASKAGILRDVIVMKDNDEIGYQFLMETSEALSILIDQWLAE